MGWHMRLWYFSSKSLHLHLQTSLHLCLQAVSSEPSLFVYKMYENRGRLSSRFRPLATQDSCICIFNSLSPGNFLCFLLSADFFQNNFFRKILSGIQSECQTVWIQTRPDILSVLIWAQTFWMTKVAASKDRVKAALSVTFDLLILELMFLFFKNTVK